MIIHKIQINFKIQFFLKVIYLLASATILGITPMVMEDLDITS